MGGMCPEGQEAQRGFLRAILIGCVLSVFTAVLEVRNMMVTIGTFLSYDASTPVAVFLIFFLGLGNLAVQRRWPRIALSPAELLLIFSMLIVANVLPTFGVIMRFIPIITGLQYFATNENGWIETIFPHARKWFLMTDADAVTGFYEGISKGKAIPWAAWVGPLAVWTVFFTACFLFILSLVTLFRRHWSERERLAYPLVQLPLAVAEERGGARFYADRLLWLGIAIPFILGSIKALHWYFPVVPDVVFFKHIPIFRNTMTITIWISFTALGISYFMGQDLAFSIWFFYLLLTLEQGIFNVTGVSLRQPVAFSEGRDIVSSQSAGAFLAFILFAVWESRASIREFVRAARRGEQGDEIFSPRTALVCLGVCGLLMLFFMRLSGIQVPVAIFLLVSIAAVYVGVAKSQALGGHVTGTSPVSPISVLTAFAGTHHFSPSTIVGFGMFTGVEREVITVNAVKLAEKRRWHGIFPLALVLSFLCCLCASYWMVIKLGYATGANNAHSWLFRSQPNSVWNFVRETIKYPTPPNPQAVTFMLGGGVVYFILAMMRFRLIWWPFHPLGFAFATVWFVISVWFSVFLGWLAKTLILRYAGVPMFRRMKGFFLGLILGQILCNVTWVLIDMALGTRGNDIFWW